MRSLILFEFGTSKWYFESVYVITASHVIALATQRQALPARAGFGGQSHQTPNPPLGPLLSKKSP
jgi:hypothetical protein